MDQYLYHLSFNYLNICDIMSFNNVNYGTGDGEHDLMHADTRSVTFHTDMHAKHVIIHIDTETMQVKHH